MKKRFICLALVMVMIFTLLPMSAFAADVVAEGTCGGNLTWALDSEGTLTISGTGAMTDYSNDSNAPWYSSRSSIKSVIIENGVTSIGDYAFCIYYSLTSATIPDSVTSIGDYAFSNCYSLTSVTIPDSVTSIGDYAFSNCYSLTSVTIPNSVTSIGNYAFYECDGLTKVTIGNSVTSIGDSAFYSCDGLTSVTIPDSVTTIGDWAFSDCYSLTSVTIGNSVTSIGTYAFRNCTGLTEINYNAKAVTDLTSSSYVFWCAGTAGSGIKVTFGDGVEKIPANLFSSCTSLTSVTIPDSVTSIGGGAFSGCSSLTSVTIPDSVTSIGDYAFYECDGLTKVTIPDSVTSIGDSAFYNCDGLTSVTIGNSVTSIGDSAFYNCDGLTSVTIPDSVTSIGDSAFYECTGLTEINYNAKAVTDLAYDADVFKNIGKAGSGITVTFGDGVEKIPANLFSSCTGLTSVTIGNGVTSIGNGAFYNCTGLTSVIIPNSVTSIGNYVFYGCYGLTSVIIPNSVTSIGNYAFYGCYGLTKVTIPDSVTSIGDYAFYDCTGLTEINYNAKAVTDLASSSKVFYNAGTAGSGIKVTFGDDVEKIPAHLFEECSSLTSVTIGNSVTSIGDSAFYECTGLTGINYNAKAVTDLTSSSKVFYNAGTAGSGIKVTFGDSVEKIPAYFFYTSNGYRPNISNVSIGSNVTSIGDYAFYGCDGLTKVTIPDSVTSIGKGAFEYCSRLTSMTIGNSVTSIGDSAFYDCTGLTSVTIGNSVTSIGDRAFYNCTGLKEINYNAKAVTDLTDSSDVFYEAGKAGSGIKVTFGEKVKKVPDYLFSTQYSHFPKIREIVFLGNAPTIGSKSFNRVTTSAYYPYGNDTWTSEVMLNYGGQITWKPYSEAEAVSVVCNGKTSYIVGEELYTSSISVTIERSDGCVETFNYASGKITLGEYDMSKSGKQSITVTCRGVTAQLNIYIHDLTSETMPANDYPESSHNYEDNLDKTYTYTADGAYALDVTFSNETETEENVDYIYVNGTTYTGKELANKTVHINGDTLTVRLVSDGSDGAYGFSIDSIVVTYLVHEYTDTVVAPTCTEKGYTTHTCVCGESHVDSYVDALGHALVHHDGKAATCTEAGWEAYGTCSRCNYTTYKEIPATGHDYIKAVMAPTCTAQGYTTYTCSCGDSYVADYKDALGHSFGEWTETTAPTCTENGVETRYCSRCDATETRDVDALGHDYKDGVCTVCGAKDPNYKPPVNPFVDVSESSIYYNAILWAYYHEPEQITGGYTATEFRPGNPCTRGQVVTFLWRAAGCPEPTGDTSMFCDTSSIASPYQKAVAWAVEKGITTGFADGTFRPNDSVTRAQFVTFLWRYEGKPATSGSIAGFTDASSISGPYQQAVSWAVEKGITTGYNDGTFRPNATCTRWAVVLFMYRDMA